MNISEANAVQRVMEALDPDMPTHPAPKFAAAKRRAAARDLAFLAERANKALGAGPIPTVNHAVRMLQKGSDPR